MEIQGGSSQKKMELSSGGWAPCSTGFPPTSGECSGNPSVSVSQLVLLWEAAFGFSECFFKTLSMCSPMSRWMIYKCTWPHYIVRTAGFHQKPHDPCAPPSLFTRSHGGMFFCFPEWKKSSKRNILPMWKRWNKISDIWEQSLKELKTES